MVGPNKLGNSAHPAERPTTPQRLPWLHDHADVNDALETLGTISKIEFPGRDEKQSPNKRIKTPTCEVKVLFSQLFYQNRDILKREIQTFLDYLDVYENDEEKLDFLLTRLTIATEDHWSSRTKPPPNAPQSNPSSPTLSIMSLKHKPKINFDDIGEIQLPRPASQAAVTSNNTSFATIFSEVPNGPQDPPSPATTIDGSSHSTQDYGSPLSETAMTTFQSKLAAAERSALTSAKSGTDLDGVNDYGTQETYYGSSPRSSTFDTFDNQDPPSEPQTATRTTAVRASKLKQVKNIVSDGLTRIRLPPSFNVLSLALRAESLRVIQSCDLTPCELDQEWEHPRNFETLHKIALKHSPTFRQGFETSYNEHSLCTKYSWSTSKSHDKPLRTAELQPPQKQVPTSFQQKFGNDRFLFVDIDSMLEPPKTLCLSDYTDLIRECTLEMLGEEQEFLGRVWIAFHLSEKTRRKPGEFHAAGTHQVIFFALSGVDLLPLGLRAPINFAIPLKENAAKSWCKAAARLDLRASRPLIILPIKRSEVEFVDDTYATDDPADSRFNDTDPKYDFSEEYDDKIVMNDGCSEAHESVFWEIRNKLKLNYTPSAVQFRSAGGKGMIFKRRPEIAEEDDRDNESRSYGPLIQITKSQSKVTLEQGFDSVGFALNVVAVSKPLAPSFLYSDFLPILIDRHVPAEVIEKYAKAQAERDMEEFLDALETPESLREWIYCQNAHLENFRRDTDIATTVGFPKDLTERAIQMLEAGFDATKFESLANLVKNIAKGYLMEQKKGFKIQIGRSTLAFAIADPTGTLRPGEIQLNFSSPFEDPVSGNFWSFLSGPVLVTRNPAARSSDIQKVKAVYKPQLAHLFDVVIFSAKGRRPLADKCSGGDYDGDMFWICWESSLVKDFRNASAPASLPEPQVFGIEVDERQLRDIVPDPESEDQVRRFVLMAIRNRFKPSLLGIVTKTRERLVYKNNSLSSQTVTDLTDLKDLIMDSDKNGRNFASETWTQFKKDRDICELPSLAYDNAADNDSINSAKSENILDSVHCLIVRPIINGAYKAMNNRLANASVHDEDLSQFYDRTLADAPSDSIIRMELTGLQHKLGLVKELWCEQTALINSKRNSTKSISWESAALLCRSLFDEIQPDNLLHDIVREWLRPLGKKWPTTWVLLKTSALAKYYPRGLLWYNIAGSEMCILKTLATEKAIRPMTIDSYKLLKYRKRKRPLRDVSEVDLFDEVNLDVDVGNWKDSGY